MPLPKLFRALAIWGLWLVIALVTSVQQRIAGIAGGTAQPWVPALVNGIGWYSAWALLTPLVIAVARRVADERRVAVLAAAHLAAAFVCATLHALLYTVFNAILYGNAVWAPWSMELLWLKLASSIHVNLMIYAIIAGIVLGARTYRKLRDRELATARLEAQLAGAEVAALRAQLQPHFLFNTLNAISALVPTEPVAAQRMIARLGDLLRLSIEQNQGQETSLADELEFTDAYLTIEQARLGERLRVVREVDPEVLGARVPTLLLQPLAENAVRHGIAPIVAGGTLKISASGAGDRLRIEVADDGRGAAQVIEGVGLGNIRQRLRQLYGERQSLDVETRPGAGFRVAITVPR